MALSAKEKARKAKASAAAKSKSSNSSKRTAAKANDTALTTKIVKARSKAKPDTWGVIAENLSITSGKAQYLYMVHQVAEGEIPGISATTDQPAKLKTALTKGRKAGESWGLLSARSGIPEARLKRFAEEQGIPVAGERVSRKSAGGR